MTFFWTNGMFVTITYFSGSLKLSKNSSNGCRHKIANIGQSFLPHYLEDVTDLGRF